MYVEAAEFDLLLGDVHSLKGKRAIIRPLIAQIRRTWPVAAAEAGHLDLHRRSLIGVAAVAPDAKQCRALLDDVERMVAERPELRLLSARRRLLGPRD